MGAFALAGVSTAVVIPTIRRSVVGDASVGVTALLASASIWAFTEAGRLLTDSLVLTEAFYTVGLLVGLATVVAFLYFVSAFTGHEYHTDRTLRVITAVAFGGIGALKLTNPIHGAYFTLAETGGAVPTYAVQLGALHWSITLVVYLLAGIGLVQLYRFLNRVDRNMNRLVGFSAFLPLPVVLDLAAHVEGIPLLPVFYEPVGVAAFALGTAWFARSQLAQAPVARRHLIDELDLPICIVDPSDRITECNSAFARFNSVTDPTGSSIESLPTTLQRAIRGESATVSWSKGGDRKTYRAISSAVELGPHRLGRVLILVDITDAVQQAREVTRHNHEVRNFSEVASHELRNVASILTGHLDVVRRRADPADPTVADSIEVITDATTRMETLIDQFMLLLDDSQTVSTVRPIDIGHLMSIQATDSEADTTVTGDDGTLVGDPQRVDHLLRSAVSLADATETHLQCSVSHGVVTLRFVGLQLDVDQPMEAFEFGRSIPSAETGLYLPTVGLVARAHHWDVSADQTSGSVPELVVTIETDPGEQYQLTTATTQE